MYDKKEFAIQPLNAEEPSANGAETPFGMHALHLQNEIATPSSPAAQKKAPRFPSALLE